MKRFMSKSLTAAVLSAVLTATAFAAPVSAAEVTIVNSNFESGTDGWTTMGRCNVSKAGWTKHSGNNSLYISNREKSWCGALYNLNGKVQAGSTYNASAYFMSCEINNDIQVRLTLSYKDNSGNTKYSTVASSTAGRQQWKEMKGSFTIPAGASNPVIYFETSDKNGDVYIDDVKITRVSGSSQSTTQPTEQPTTKPTTQPTTNPSTPSNFGNKDYYQNATTNVNPPYGFKSSKNGVTYGQVQGVSYYSSVTRNTRRCNVILPPNYDSSKKYPVLYLLHGIGGDQNEWLGGSPNEILSNLVATGEASRMIIVIPNVRASYDDRVPSDIYGSANVQGFDNFINDLRDCLIPFINQKYPTLTGRENTAIAGLSMGGKESLSIGFSMTDTFGYIGAFSPAPGLDTSILHLRNGKKTPYFVSIMCGQNDSVVHNIPNDYHNALSKNGVKHAWYTIRGDHNFDVWSVGLYNFLKHIF